MTLDLAVISEYNIKIYIYIYINWTTSKLSISVHPKTYNQQSEKATCERKENIFANLYTDGTM